MAIGHAGEMLRNIQRWVETQTRQGSSDGQLLQRFAVHREEGAFAALVRRHGQLVWGVCRHVLRHEHDAEDAFQATFLVLSRRAGAIRKTESVASWLHGVAYRIAVRAKKMTATRQQRERQAPAPEAQCPSADSAVRELQAILDEVLQRLPEKYREPFVLSCLEGHSRKETAAELGLKEGTVSSRIAHARRLLQDRLARRGVVLSAALTTRVLWGEMASACAPAALMQATLKTALLVAAGQNVAQVAAPSVRTLVDGALKAMTAVKPKIATAFLLTISLLGGVGLAVSQRPEEQAKPAAVQPVTENPEPKIDAFGDLLPPGAMRRLGTLRFRHGGGVIHQLLLTPDGKTLLSSSLAGSGTVCAWELATGRLLQQFPGNYEVRDSALSSDGKTLATCQRDAVVLWDVASGKELQRLQQPSPTGIAFSPGGKILASASDRGLDVLLWNLTTGKEVRRLSLDPAASVSNVVLAFSRDGQSLIAARMFGSKIDVWDLATATRRHQLDTQVEATISLVLSPTGDLLTTPASNGTITLWNVGTGQPVQTIQTGQRSVASVAFSSDGKTLLAVEVDADLARHLCLWDLATSKRVRVFSRGMEQAGIAVFSTDGKTLLTGGGGRAIRAGTHSAPGVDSTIRLWDATTGEERGPALGQPRFVDHLTLSPNGETLAYVKERDIQLLDVATGRETGNLAHDPDGVTALAFAPDGRTLVAGEALNAIRLWDVGARRILRKQELVKEKGDRAWMGVLAFSPDGRTLAGGGWYQDARRGGLDGTVWLWDAATGKELRRLAIIGKTEGWAPIMGLTFSADGKYLATSSRAHKEGSRVHVWETGTGKKVAYLTSGLNERNEGGEPARLETWEINRITPNIVASPDGRLLARNGQSKALGVWEAATGQRRCILLGHEDSILRVAFAPDGRTLASASADNTIRLWDLATGTELRRLTGHRGTVNSLVFTHDGKMLISAGDDTTILFWNVAAVTQRDGLFEPLARAKGESLWSDLAGTDAARAHRAIARLTSAGPTTVTAFREQMRPAPALDARQMAQMVRDLDSKEFAVRSKATRQLEELGEAAEPALQEALKNPPCAEVRRRVQQLLSELVNIGPPGEQRRGLRAIEVLEHIATPEARELLENLASGAPEAPATCATKAALERLARQVEVRP